MKKIMISIMIMAVLIFIGFEILTESETILQSVAFSFSVWSNNIFPSLFPFFVLSEILVQYGFIELVGELFKPFMNRFFKVDGVCAFVFIMAFISGFPSNAKYTRELYVNGSLDAQTASKILAFTHFSNPLFIMGTLSVLFLNNKEVGLLILICHYIGNVFVGLLLRNYHAKDIKKEKVSFKKAILQMHQKRISSTRNFGQTVTDSLLHSIHTLLLILGVVSMFLVITTIIDNNLNVNSLYQSLINGFFEMTQGLKYISLQDIPLKLKSVFSTMILSFGGLSVHMQIISIISDTKIRYLPFLVGRVIHTTFSSVLVYCLFDFWIQII